MFGNSKKTRFILDTAPGYEAKWEVDLFHNPPGMKLAEVESESLDFLKIKTPSWLGEEVTGDSDYYNRNLL